MQQEGGEARRIEPRVWLVANQTPSSPNFQTSRLPVKFRNALRRARSRYDLTGRDFCRTASIMRRYRCVRAPVLPPLAVEQLVPDTYIALVAQSQGTFGAWLAQ